MGIASMPIDGGGMGDLSGFDSYALVMHNPNERPIHVNIYMNTGWTDNNQEPDYFYENGWEWLNPDATVTLRIDFASARRFSGGSLQGMYAVDNLNHVSNIGFQVALPALMIPIRGEKEGGPSA